MIYLIITAVFIIADQISKNAVVSSMQLGESRTVIDGVFDLYYIHNDGAAYSILQGKQALLIVFTVILMIGILVYMFAYRKTMSAIESIALALILGGGIGNLIDRIAYGYVIDFLNIHIIPIFNVADIAITCGCILFAVTVLFSKKDK